jgi:hypothetical protein
MMTKTASIAVATAILAALLAVPATAQTASGSGASEAPAAQEPRRARKKAKKGEMSVKGMAASEWRKKCGAEWKEAKTAGKTEGLKWPKFYRQCNARLKGNSA